ncbi:MAG: hypothetical protein AUI52_05425 [Acidobacteria bacterium 13_1_40CM_2_68_10]|nr:MAG: hypothetical protein AUI52_05425 [Acidobacteria bacterium 13_1_40CM_2_68_10]
MIDPAAALPLGAAVRYGPTGEPATVVGYATYTRLPVVEDRGAWVYQGEEVAGPYIIETAAGAQRAATRDELELAEPRPHPEE